MKFEEFINLLVLQEEELINLPKYAFEFLEEGFDDEEFIIIAGLSNDYWETKKYFERIMKKKGRTYPKRDEAGMNLIRIYLERVIDKEIEPILALEIIRKKVLLNSDWSNKSEKYAYDFIEFQNLYGLYWQCDDIIEKYKRIDNKKKMIEEELKEYKEKIFEEIELYLEKFEEIKDKVVRNS